VRVQGSAGRRADPAIRESPWVETEVQRADGEYVVFPMRTKAQFKHRKCRGVVEERAADGSWALYSTTPWTLLAKHAKHFTAEEKNALAFRIGDTVIEHVRDSAPEHYAELLASAEVVPQ